MKHVLLCVVLAGLLGSWNSPARSHGPFAAAPESGPEASGPLFKSPVFAKIVFWQYRMQQKMSELIRVSQGAGSVAPLVVLMGLAFLYGLIHAAGPGHGKVVATSYVLSHQATIAGGMLFGLIFALTHALSGLAGVVGLRYLIERSCSATLASVTTKTQIVSFGMITLLGLVVLAKHGHALINPAASHEARLAAKESRKNILAWAASIGLTPCPAVVTVMLFCLSMDAMMLGFLLAACISLGMAATVSLVVIAVATGKAGILSTVPENCAIRVESLVGSLSGAAVAVFGALFLLATMNSVP